MQVAVWTTCINYLFGVGAPVCLLHCNSRYCPYATYYLLLVSRRAPFGIQKFSKDIERIQKCCL